MKRYTLRILQCLFLGIFTTVGVAWGIVVAVGLEMKNVDSGLSLRSNPDNHLWSCRVSQSTGSCRVVSYRLASAFSGIRPPVTADEICPAWASSRVAPPDADMWSYDYLIIDERRGWPLLALEGSLQQRTIKRSMVVESPDDFQTKWAIFIGKRASSDGNYWSGDELILPFRPVLPGFLFNTILYGVIWWMLLIGPWYVRRLFRTSRGHCMICGYNLRGDIEAGCSECGWNRTGTETKSAAEKEMK